ncbi:hypothetical protein GN956_G1991 [Arapaima gigas]
MELESGDLEGLLSQAVEQHSQETGSCCCGRSLFTPVKILPTCVAFTCAEEVSWRMSLLGRVIQVKPVLRGWLLLDPEGVVIPVPEKAPAEDTPTSD